MPKSAWTEKDQIDNFLKERSIKVKEFQRSFSHSDTERLPRNDEVLKLKNFKKDAALKVFKIIKSRKAVDRVVAPTPGSAITIPETANEFSIKGNHLSLVKGNQFDGRTKTNPHKDIHEFLGIYDMFKYRDTENEAVRLMMFPLSLTREAKAWLNELNEGPIETWDEL
ncbi:hypothetical protein Tco_0567881 [Tanacetum coccineum]